MERLSVEDYYREAFDVLGESGSEGLTISALCERLQVTKGSFYHHFGSMPGLRRRAAAVLGVRAQRTADRDLQGPAGPDAAHRGLIEHRRVAAARQRGRDPGLGPQQPRGREVTVRVDRRRERHISDAIVALGIERPPARLLGGYHEPAHRRAAARAARRPQTAAAEFEEFQKLVFLEADPELVAHLCARRVLSRAALGGRARPERGQLRQRAAVPSTAASAREARSPPVDSETGGRRCSGPGPSAASATARGAEEADVLPALVGDEVAVGAVNGPVGDAHRADDGGGASGVAAPATPPCRRRPRPPR